MITLLAHAVNRTRVRPFGYLRLVLNFMAAEVRVAEESSPLLRNVPSLAVGELVEGEHFPIVWDRLRAGSSC